MESDTLRQPALGPTNAVPISSVGAASVEEISTSVVMKGDSVPMVCGEKIKPIADPELANLEFSTCLTTVSDGNRPTSLQPVVTELMHPSNPAESQIPAASVLQPAPTIILKQVKIEKGESEKSTILTMHAAKRRGSGDNARGANSPAKKGNAPETALVINDDPVLKRSPRTSSSGCIIA